MDGRRSRLVADLLAGHGQTFADQAGIRLRDEPSPLYRLLVLCGLLSARIPSQLAVTAAAALAKAGWRTPRAMHAVTWQQRVDVLGAAGYRRFDERTSTMLDDGAVLLMDRWGGDLRRMRAEAAGDVNALRALLQQVPGIGPVGSSIFCREVQGVWSDIAPFADQRVQDGARLIGLPGRPSALARLVPAGDLPRLAAACVRLTLDPGIADDLRRARARA